MYILSQKSARNFTKDLSAVGLLSRLFRMADFELLMFQNGAPTKFWLKILTENRERLLPLHNVFL